MTCTHTGIMTVGTLPPVTADGNDGYVIKFGPDGTPTWTTTVTGQGYQALARIAVQMDGTFYAVVSGEYDDGRHCMYVLDPRGKKKSQQLRRQKRLGHKLRLRKRRLWQQDGLYIK